MRRLWVLAILVVGGRASAQPVPEPATDVDANLAPPPPPPDDGGTGDDTGDDKTDKDKDKGKKAKAKSAYVPEVGGYVQGVYENEIDTDDDGTSDPDVFRFERVRLKVTGKLHAKVGYEVEIDPSAGESLDLLKDAYVHVDYIPFHELRLGQQKTQFGWENVESSTKLYWVNRAHASTRIGRGRTARDLGVGIVGEIPIAGAFSVEDGVTFVNGAGANAQGDDNDGKDVWGRLGARFHDKSIDVDARAGGSVGVGTGFEPGTDPVSPIDDYRYDFLRFGADVQVDWTHVFVAAEYFWGRDTDQQTNNEIETTGYYVALAGKTPWKVGPVVRFDKHTDDYKRWTFGAYWGGRNARLRAMIDYEHRIDRDDRVIVWGQAKF
jgi:hypothetical protein